MTKTVLKSKLQNELETIQFEEKLTELNKVLVDYERLGQVKAVSYEITKEFYKLRQLLVQIETTIAQLEFKSTEWES